MSTETDDDIALGAMGESLGFLLRLSQLESFRDFYAGLGDMGVRPGEFSVLMLVAGNPGIRQGILARKLMIKRAHMTKMIQAMESEGLIDRRVPEDDRRSIELRLTAAGRKRVDDMRAPFEEHEARNLTRLTPTELTEAKRLLKKYLGLPA